MTGPARAALRWGGRLVTLLTLAFVAREVWLRRESLGGWQPGAGDLALVAGLSAAYGLALFLLAWVWARLVTTLHSERLPDRVLFRSYTDSQIAKYLPGNVFHFVGRHLMLRAEGVRDATLGRAVALELGLMLAAAACIVLAASLAVPWPGTTALGRMLNAAAAPGLALAGLLLLLLLVPAGPAQPVRRTLALCLLPAAGFFTVMGLLAWIPLARIADLPAGSGIGGAVAAWVAGFVTPGAPGGLGPREAAFVALFRDRTPPEAALLGMGLFRAVTLGGDILCFLLGRALFRRPR